MSTSIEKPPKIGNEITVRISLTFQEAPDIHTLLAMTPVRERGKLIRLALERYIAGTAHPAGNVENQISAISNWLRSRVAKNETPICFSSLPTAHLAMPGLDARDALVPPVLPHSGEVVRDISSDLRSSSVNRWLND